MHYRDDEDDFDRIENSNLPPRLAHILLTNGITRFSTLARMSDAEILLLRNIGRDYLMEIRARLGR